MFVHAGAKERIHTFVTESFAAFESDPDLYTYLILREHSELEKFAGVYAHPGDVVIRIIEEGQKSGNSGPAIPMCWVRCWWERSEWLS